MAVTQAQVAQLYVALFNRAPEGAGFNAWVAAGATKTVAQMANEMLASPATPPYFASLGIDISTDRGYVENIYKNILGKDYSQDPDGINAWVRHLQLGNSRGDTLVKLFEVATSAEARIADPVAAQTFANKTAISQYAAQKIADIPTDENGAYDFSLFQRIIAQTNNTNLDAQKAAIDALVAPTVHNLSSDANNVSGTDKADLFNGAVSATVNQTTFKDTDKIDGKGGNDTLNLDMYTNFYGLATDRGEVKNIENLKLTNHTSGHLTFNARNIHDMQTISIDGSTYKYGLDIINPENKVKLNLKNIDLSQTGAQNLRLIYNTDVLAGTNDDQEVTVDNVKTGNNKINITTVNNDKVEAVTINALSGVNKLTGFISDHVGSSDDSSIKTIKVKGSAELEITGPSSLQTFDASAYTGNKLTANLKANSSVQHIIGSSQDDTFNVTGASGRIIPIDGGAGKDTVNFIDAISGNQHVEMSGVEELNINTNASVLDFTRAQEITELGINGTSPRVEILNSKIQTVNANATSTTNVTINDSADFQNFNVVKGTEATLTANGATKLNVKVDNASTLATTQGTSSTTVNSNTVKEINFTLDNTTSTNTGFGQNLNNVSALETLNVVNKTSKNITANITAADTSGLTTVNVVNLKTLNIETKGNYSTASVLSGISAINLKGTGEETSVTFGTNMGTKPEPKPAGVERVPVPTKPLWGVQDITLNAQGLKNLDVVSSGQIWTSRDIKFTSNTDKADATVKYGNMGYFSSTYNPNTDYKVNNVILVANGQKTLSVNSINATGDVNVTTHFAQGISTDSVAPSVKIGVSNTSGFLLGKNITINHTSDASITNGEINVYNFINASNNLNVNASGYKKLSVGNQAIFAGAADINTTATVAGSETRFDTIQNATNGIKINATAANGITDAKVTYKNLTAIKKGIDVTFSNMKEAIIDGNIRASGTTSDTKGDINITISSNIPGSIAKITGVTKNEGGGVTIKASGQKTLEVGTNVTSDASVRGVDGDVDINISANQLDATAKFFGEIQSANKNVTIKANGFGELQLTEHSGVGGHIRAEKGNLSISTGTNRYLQKVEIGLLTAKTMDLNFSNVIAPINSHVTMPNRNKILIESQDNLNFKGYAGDDVTWIYHVIKDLDSSASNEAKDFVANIVNAKGGIGGDPDVSAAVNNFTETITLKGGITNPDSITSRGGDTSMSIRLDKLAKIKSVDASEYNNASGTTNIQGNAINTELVTIKGAATKNNITIASTKLKLVEGGAGDDTVTFSTVQVNDIKVNLGAGNDTITTAALTANKKFEISGGAGNDKFKLAASMTTDNTASKYVTITDASRGDKIGLSDSVTGFVKTNANATSGQTDLKDAINAALASQGTTTANNIYAVYYGNETYLVRDADASKTLSAGDNLVKLAGLSNYDVLNGNVITDTDGVTKLLEITNA